MIKIEFKEGGNNARNDLIAYCKVMGMACDDCATLLNLSLERVWMYWKLIDIHIYQGINYSEDLKLDWNKYHNKV